MSALVGAHLSAKDETANLTKAAKLQHTAQRERCVGDARAAGPGWAA